MNQTPEPEDSLVERIRHGSEDALAEFFGRHRERLWRLVHFRMDPRLQGRVDPEDVLQEAFVDVAKRIRIWVENPSMPLRLWVRLTVGQTLIEVHRRHLLVQARSVEHEVPGRLRMPGASSVTLSAHLAGSLTSPSRAAIREEAKRLLHEAIEQMDPIDRQVLTMRHFEELSNAEVAEELGLQPSTASARYIRALARLKDALRPLDPDTAKGSPP